MKKIYAVNILRFIMFGILVAIIALLYQVFSVVLGVIVILYIALIAFHYGFTNAIKYSIKWNDIFSLNKVNL